MKNNPSRQYLLRALYMLLLALPIAAGLYLLKKLTDESPAEPATATTAPIEPITTLPEEHATIDKPEAQQFTAIDADTLVTDHRPPMEAGDEDGYWDGWADGAEARAQRIAPHLARKTFDPKGNYATADDRAIYAEAYREAYETGFAEALHP